jgi:hypothetical protein
MKLIHIFIQIFCTKIGWLFFCLLLTIIFGILANYYDWCEIAMFICFIYPVVLTLIMIVYAFVINPLRDYKENKKIKEQYKKDHEQK